jgi:hypothetical protein
MGCKAMTVAELHDQYVSTAGWDVYTRKSNLGLYPRIIKPALGSARSAARRCTP